MERGRAQQLQGGGDGCNESWCGGIVAVVVVVVAASDLIVKLIHRQGHGAVALVLVDLP